MMIIYDIQTEFGKQRILKLECSWIIFYKDITINYNLIDTWGRKFIPAGILSQVL